MASPLTTAFAAPAAYPVTTLRQVHSALSAFSFGPSLHKVLGDAWCVDSPSLVMSLVALRPHIADLTCRCGASTLGRVGPVESIYVGPSWAARRIEIFDSF
eukprot:3122871-Amphidinium_carterae.1